MIDILGTLIARWLEVLLIAVRFVVRLAIDQTTKEVNRLMSPYASASDSEDSELGELWLNNLV
ncbi:hypothetical protein C7271_00890 [filamentous cyanobacterium CCP5]|nr:hypothetical protein C7271_00890 [filamentous cyanobacterium CCP5]